MMYILKPCPFCGNAAKVNMTRGWDSDKDAWYSVECIACCVKTDDWSSEEQAAHAWNRRIENEL